VLSIKNGLAVGLLVGNPVRRGEGSSPVTVGAVVLSITDNGLAVGLLVGNPVR